MFEVTERISGNWIEYENKSGFLSDKSRGKWMFTSQDVTILMTYCHKAVSEGIVSFASHSMDDENFNTGIACLYIDGDSKEEHGRKYRWTVWTKFGLNLD
jgi:hypothetical protein